MMKKTVEGSVPIYPRAVAGKVILRGITCFSGSREEDQCHQRGESRKLTANLLLMSGGGDIIIARSLMGIR